ncbi:3-deoxy-7-phosphoheptulonate synthase [Candidatus Woesearchaeota archaeon]|nr:3-deoxy-7-phosphoheptulonate synthase [Candidatus Woesearchaeota archaeon]
MGLHLVGGIPLPGAVKEELPCDVDVEHHRTEIKAILAGKDKRRLLILGPCSAWPSESVLQYVSELKELEAEVQDRLKLIIRVYTQKPRTTLGWTGPANQPEPLKSPDLAQGVFYCRRMMLDVLRMGFPIADELLFTHMSAYFDDLLSWTAIGARSGEDQEHRFWASAADFPVGIKNPTSGNLNIGVNSVIAAQHPHHFAYFGDHVRSTGNVYAHLVLRGGDGRPNITEPELLEAASLMRNCTHPAIIVDASHENCMVDGKKNPNHQPQAILDTIALMHKHTALDMIKGFMMESYMHDGNQPITEHMDLTGLSITDPCIGIDGTKKAIKAIYSALG